MSDDWSLLGGNPIPLTAATVFENAQRLRQISADWQRDRNAAMAGLGDVVRFWRGTAGQAWTATQQRIGVDLLAPVRQLDRSAQVLADFGTVIGQLAEAAAGLLPKALSIQADMDRTGYPTLASELTTGPSEQHLARQRQLLSLQQQAELLHSEYLAAHRRCVRDLESLAVARLLRAGRLVTDRELAVLTQLAVTEHAGIEQLLRSLPPGQLAGLFGDLTPAAADALASTGGAANLDGTPLSLRAQVNRLRAEDDLSAAILDGDQARISLLRSLLQPGAGLILYDPAADHYGVLWGDPATQDVAVFVPGVGSDGNVPGWVRSAKALNQASGAAVIMWKGYADPGGSGTADIINAAYTQRAHDGAQLLTSFCHDGLQLESGQQLTVVAHSYGSVVTGVALADDGLRPSRVVVAGSPGLTVDNRAQLHLQPGQFYAEHAPGDYVANNLAGFGPDPAGPSFGGIRLATNGPGYPGVSGHSEYFQARTQAIQGIADAIKGQVSPADVQSPTAADRLADTTSGLLYPGRSVVDQLTRNLPGPVADAAHLANVADNNVNSVTRYVITNPGAAIRRVESWLP